MRRVVPNVRELEAEVITVKERRVGIARVAWMANHAWWIGALFVSVQSGLLYSDLCDSAYANGDNGPFGYGQHAGRANLIVAMLIIGLLGAGALSILFRDRILRTMRVANLTIGTVGGAVASWDLYRQTERNPYCTVGGIWPLVAFASILLAAAVLANIGVVDLAVNRLLLRNEG